MEELEQLSDPTHDPTLDPEDRKPDWSMVEDIAPEDDYDYEVVWNGHGLEVA
jgi:hypothetical protein